jgi:hypothetical protein
MGWLHLLDHAFAHARDVSMVAMMFLLATAVSVNPMEKAKYQHQTLEDKARGLLMMGKSHAARSLPVVVRKSPATSTSTGSEQSAVVNQGSIDFMREFWNKQKPG